MIGGLSAANSSRMNLTHSTAQHTTGQLAHLSGLQAAQASFGRKAGDSTRPFLKTFVDEKHRIHPDSSMKAAKNSSNSKFSRKQQRARPIQKR